MANASIPARPAPLAVFKTCYYKFIDNTSIAIDIYLPLSPAKTLHPIMLFIHGGGWKAGDRLDYSRPIFLRFLSLGFLVASMEYRLLPETPFSWQLQDIRDIEPWLCTQLPFELQNEGIEVDTKKIVIVGASAGAHLALLAPKLFTHSPLAILSLYGPTNMLHLPYLNRGMLSKLPLPPMTPELLALAVDFTKTPTRIPIGISAADFMKPRAMMSMAVFKGEVIAEFLLRGLVREESGKLSLPKKGSVAREEIEEISPLHLCEKIRYPPTYQIMGTADEVFEVSHVMDFDASLKKQGIESQAIVAPELGHSFDTFANLGDEIDEKILKPAVEWIAGFAGVKGL